MYKLCALGCALILVTFSGAADAAVQDGVYTGFTSQNRTISITVSGGVIDEFSINWSCGGTSATSTDFPDCTIAVDGSFSCGSSVCPATPYVAGMELSGTFSGTDVSGSYDLAFNTGDFAGTCCYVSDITYSASVTPSQPMLSISDTSLSEKDQGSSTTEFQVTLNPAAASSVTVDWATADGSADSSDYAPNSGTLTFSAGQTSQKVGVTVYGDTSVEGDEVFYVDLDNASNAGITDGRGRCTIVDDDSSETEKPQSVVPAAGRGGGAGGSMWITSFNARNDGSSSASVSLLWLRRDQPNLEPLRYETTIPAGATLVMDDVIMEAFGLSEGGGAIGVVSDQPLTATAVILNTAGGNEFGQGFPAIPVGAATEAGVEATVVGLKHNATYRTNVFVVDVTGNGSTVTLTILDAAGAVRSTKEVVLGPYMPKLVSLSAFEVTDIDNCVLVISTSSGAVVGGASRVNAGTGDPVTLSPPIETTEGGDGTCDSDGRYQVAVYDDDGWARSGGHFDIVDNKLDNLDVTYSNGAKTDCNFLFRTRASFSPRVDLADLAAGVENESPYSIGTLTFTWRIQHDGNAGFTGTVDVVGSEFTGDDEGCNGSFSTLTVAGGKSD